VVILILCGLVVLSVVLDLDMLLGAFAAGVVWQLLMRNAPEEDRRAVESKVEGVAFGLFIPIFFVYTGVTFDLQALLADPLSIALLPITLVLLLVIRGLPSMLAAPVGSSRRDTVALGIMGATALPIVVAVTTIGLDAGIIAPGLAAALVGAGMLSVLFFPGTAMLIRGERVRANPWREPVEEEEG
jgi:Kef-type K+ transport system membrane component KefB